MCGRYDISSPIATLIRLFRVHSDIGLFAPNYNASPSQHLPVVFNDSPDQLSPCTWGFLPPWSTAAKPGKAIINARSETAATSPVFKKAFATQRCLVVADSFFEGRQTETDKQPYRGTDSNGAENNAKVALLGGELA